MQLPSELGGIGGDLLETPIDTSTPWPTLFNTRSPKISRVLRRFARGAPNSSCLDVYTLPFWHNHFNGYGCNSQRKNVNTLPCAHIIEKITMCTGFTPSQNLKDKIDTKVCIVCAIATTIPCEGDDRSFKASKKDPRSRECECICECMWMWMWMYIVSNWLMNFSICDVRHGRN